MIGRTCLIILLTILSHSLFGQPFQDAVTNSIVVEKSTNVSWWAGIIEHGFQMPLADGYTANICEKNYENQIQPLLLSDQGDVISVSYTHLRAHETGRNLVCRLLLE